MSFYQSAILSEFVFDALDIDFEVLFHLALLFFLFLIREGGVVNIVFTIPGDTFFDRFYLPFIYRTVYVIRAEICGKDSSKV